MKVYTVHLRPERVPLLVPEGFSLGCFLLGGIWLLARRAWIPGILALAAAFLIGFLTSEGSRIALELGLAVLLGLIGRDLRRWSLARRGFTAAHLVAAGNTDGAISRLLSLRPDLAPRFVPAQELP